MMASHFRFTELLRRSCQLVLLALATHGAHAATDEAGTVPACAPVPDTVVAPGSMPNKVRLVTGAPYSALGTSETVTTLADGNRIVRQNKVRLWRDSDGRTRSEFSLSSIGGPLPLELNTTVTVIDDPEARQRYMLQPAERVAVTVPIVPCRASAPARDAAAEVPRKPSAPLNVSARVQLGERTMDGQTVEGSRIEATIPAGAIGNLQPIKMSAEQWYGRELQVVVEAYYRDPRSGDTRYKLSDIQRAEPDASLFRVPNGYAKQPALRGIRERRR
jgi:hypothetical protein